MYHRTLIDFSFWFSQTSRGCKGKAKDFAGTHRMCRGYISLSYKNIQYVHFPVSNIHIQPACNFDPLKVWPLKNSVFFYKYLLVTVQQHLKRQAI